MNIPPRLRRILAYAGYPAFYVVCLVIFSYVCAPWDRLKNAIVTNFNTTSPLRMQVDKLTWAWRFPGVVAKGVKFVGTPPAAEPGA